MHWRLVEEKDGLLTTALTWDSGDLDWSLGSTTGFLCDRDKVS